MERRASRLLNIAGGLWRLVFFVFLILGIPVIIFLPVLGFEWPTVPPLVDRIVTTLFYIFCVIVCGALVSLITYVVLADVYSRAVGKPMSKGREAPTLLGLALWCWWGILLSGAFVGSVKQLFDLWWP